MYINTLWLDAYVKLALKFGLTASVPELERCIPSLLMMFLLKVAGDSWVLGTETRHPHCIIFC